MKHYDYQAVFDSYKDTPNLSVADIFHLYDTGKECFHDNSGYQDARHMRVVAFNSETMQKCDLGIHDGIITTVKEEAKLFLIRMYADGSTLIRLKEPVDFSNNQAIHLYPTK